MEIRFPKPLRRGDRIGVTAPSSGVAEGAPRRRMEFAIDMLRRRGYDVVVGECMSAARPVSAPKAQRAAELTAMLCDPTIRAVVPPWGGFTGIDLLDLLDYEAIAAAEPTWVVGYSDTSTLMMPLLLRAGLASIHGYNLADTPYVAAEGLLHWLDFASHDPGAGPLVQRDSGVVAARYHFDDDLWATRWKVVGQGAWTVAGDDPVDVTGRLVGGCIETVSALAGTPFGDMRAFGAEHGPLVVYLEAADEEAFSICRMLHQLRYAGWFDDAAAVLIGRTNAPASTSDGGMNQRDAVLDALGDLCTQRGLPLVFDLEIGHVPPHLPLLNGAQARIMIADHRRGITQTWP